MTHALVDCSSKVKLSQTSSQMSEGSV